MQSVYQDSPYNGEIYMFFKKKVILNLKTCHVLTIPQFLPNFFREVDKIAKNLQGLALQ